MKKTKSLFSLFLSFLFLNSLHAADYDYVTRPGLMSYGFSSNGKYVIGNKGVGQPEQYGWVWDWENDEYLQLTEPGETSLACQVLENGTIIGQYNMQAAFFEDGQWYPLPMPSFAKPSNASFAKSASEDRSIIVGSVDLSGESQGAFPLKWIKTGPYTYVMDTLAYKKGSETEFRTGYMNVMPEYISADGKRITGRFCWWDPYFPVSWTDKDTLTWDQFLEDSIKYYKADDPRAQWKDGDVFGLSPAIPG